METPSRRPTVVGMGPPTTAPESAVPQPSPDQSIVRMLMRDAIDEAKVSLKAEMGGAPGPAGQGPGARFPGALILVLALGGAFLLQRGEATRDMLAQSQAQQVQTQARMEERLAAAEKAQAQAGERATRSEDTLREAFWVLAEDSRANWDALGAIHEATKPAGAPVLRAPATSARLSSLREKLATP